MVLSDVQMKTTLGLGSFESVDSLLFSLVSLRTDCKYRDTKKISSFPQTINVSCEVKRIVTLPFYFINNYNHLTVSFTVLRHSDFIRYLMYTVILLFFQY